MNWKSSAWITRRVILFFVLGLLLFSSTGCAVRRLARVFRGSSSGPKMALKAPPRKMPRRNLPRQNVPRPDVREIMARQAAGAFDPATGDRRVQLLNSKLRLDPQDAEARLELGAIYEQYSMDEPALEQFTRALNLDPESLPALLALSRVARRTPAAAAEAIPVVRAFLARHPDEAAALSALGSLLDVTGDPPAAEAAYRQGLKRLPDAAYLRNNLGFNLLLQNRLSEAIAEFRRALDLNPRSAAARNNLGLALARSGDLEAALKEFAGNGADPATAHNNLAVALLEQGELEASRAQLLKALSARSFFLPALENFRMVLDRDRDLLNLPLAVPFRPAIPAGWMLPLPVPPSPDGNKKQFSGSQQEMRL